MVGKDDDELNTQPKTSGLSGYYVTPYYMAIRPIIKGKDRKLTKR